MNDTPEKPEPLPEEYEAWLKTQATGEDFTPDIKFKGSFEEFKASILKQSKIETIKIGDVVVRDEGALGLNLSTAKGSYIWLNDEGSVKLMNWLQFKYPESTDEKKEPKIISIEWSGVAGMVMILVLLACFVAWCFKAYTQ